MTLDTTNSAGSFANNKDETSAGFRANVLYAATDAAGNVVTDLDSSSIHFLIDDGIDMTGKFAGMIETVI